MFLNDNLLVKSNLLISSLGKYLQYIIINSTFINFYIFCYDLKFIITFLIKSIFFSIDSLMDLVVADYLDKKKRFRLMYNLWSISLWTRIFVIFFVSLLEWVPSLIYMFKSVNWLEREAYDMFSIKFFNNYDLRRILTDYGFESFPLKKDFPVSGFLELRYDDSIGCVRYERVELSQALRFFVFHSGWESD